MERGGGYYHVRLLQGPVAQPRDTGARRLREFLARILNTSPRYPRRASRCRVTGGWMSTARSISTTPAGACTRRRRCGSTPICSNTAALGNPHSVSLSSSGPRRSSSARGARCSTWFNAAVTTPRSSPQNATAALKHVGESYPFTAAAASPDRRQPQLGQRHPRVRARARGAGRQYAPLTMPELRIDRSRSTHCWRRRSAAPTTCSRSRAVELLGREASARSSSTTRTIAAGTCCSTRRHSFRPIASTSPRSGPTS